MAGRGEFLVSTKAQRQEKDGMLGEKGNPLMRSGKWKEVGDGELDWILRVLGRHGRVLLGCDVIKCSFCRITLNIARNLLMV